MELSRWFRSVRIRFGSPAAEGSSDLWWEMLHLAWKMATQCFSSQEQKTCRPKVLAALVPFGGFFGFAAERQGELEMASSSRSSGEIHKG